MPQRETRRWGGFGDGDHCRCDEPFRDTGDDTQEEAGATEQQRADPQGNRTFVDPVQRCRPPAAERSQTDLEADCDEGRHGQ